MTNLTKLCNISQVDSFEIDENRRVFSATHDEILQGYTTDIYFVKTEQILRSLKLETTLVTAEIFSRKGGVLAGVDESILLLKERGLEISALKEGDEFSPFETVMRIKGRYTDFGIFETALLGILASSSGWATASRSVRQVLPDKPFTCFGARHVHPSIASVMERAALIGGADSASCVLGAKLAGVEPKGTLPHAVFLIAGDTLKVAEAYDREMPPDDLRIVLVDTFRDECEESLRVANSLKEKLHGVRLDTPGERGGVTPGLIKELRARLDLEGHKNVKIFVSGGLTPEKISILSTAGADSFGVGSYISGAPAIDMTMDLKEINGNKIAKRGRIPGILDNPRLIKYM